MAWREIGYRPFLSQTEPEMGEQTVDNLQYPEWQKPYQDALVELDKNKLKWRVVAAEAAIFNRLQTMSSSCDTSTEMQAIEDALASLCYLKKESLGFAEQGVGY